MWGCWSNWHYTPFTLSCSGLNRPWWFQPSKGVHVATNWAIQDPFWWWTPQSSWLKTPIFSDGWIPNFPFFAHDSHDDSEHPKLGHPTRQSCCDLMDPRPLSSCSRKDLKAGTQTLVIWSDSDYTTIRLILLVRNVMIRKIIHHSKNNNNDNNKNNNHSNNTNNNNNDNKKTRRRMARGRRRACYSCVVTKRM